MSCVNCMNCMNCIRCHLSRLWRKVVGESSSPASTPSSVEAPPSAQAPHEEVRSVTAADDPLNNTAWVKLAEACVELFAELDRYQADFDPPRREVAEHVCNRLMEILVRNGVGLIDADGAFDRNRHEPNLSGAGLKPGAATAHVISPGFQIGRRILRRARVEILQEPSTTGE